MDDPGAIRARRRVTGVRVSCAHADESAPEIATILMLGGGAFKEVGTSGAGSAHHHLLLIVAGTSTPGGEGLAVDGRHPRRVVAVARDRRKLRVDPRQIVVR